MFSNRWERRSDAMPLRSAVSALAPYCRTLGLLGLPVTQAARSGRRAGA